MCLEPKRHLVFNMSRTGDDVEWFGGERKVTLDKKEMIGEGVVAWHFC